MNQFLNFNEQQVADFAIEYNVSIAEAKQVILYVSLMQTIKTTNFTIVNNNISKNNAWPHFNLIRANNHFVNSHSEFSRRGISKLHYRLVCCLINKNEFSDSRLVSSVKF